MNSSEKSHVGMGYSVCPVCGVEHDPVVLLDKRLDQTLTRHEFAGWALCAEHQKMKDEGYIALVGCSNEPKGLADACRTGDLIHIRASAWSNIFNSPVPPKGLAFISQDAVTKLREMVEETTESAT